MKTHRKKQLQKKQIIQERLDSLSHLKNLEIPSSGWIKTIRTSLGLSIRQLAHLVGVNHASINQIEKREAQKNVTLASLEKAAHAMDCKLIYAIVPNNSSLSLDKIIRTKATKAALEIMNEVSHSMRLEAQGVSKKQNKDQIKILTNLLIDTNNPRIWKK